MRNWKSEDKEKFVPYEFGYGRKAYIEKQLKVKKLKQRKIKSKISKQSKLKNR